MYIHKEHKGCAWNSIRLLNTIPRNFFLYRPWLYKIERFIRKTLLSYIFKSIDCGKQNFTVLQVFKSIFYELAFCGTPVQRDQMLRKLIARANANSEV